MLQLETVSRGDLTVVRAAGSVKSGDNADFAAALAEAGRAGPRRVLLDLGGLDYVNSQAMADLINLHERLKARGGALALAGLRPMVEKVIRAVGLIALVEVHDSAERAIEAMGGDG
jgi:anti-sigma B factor antagonist